MRQTEAYHTDRLRLLELGPNGCTSFEECLNQYGSFIQGNHEQVGHRQIKVFGIWIQRLVLPGKLGTKMKLNPGIFGKDGIMAG